MTKDEILKKYEDDNEYHLHQVDREWVLQAMQEYADQQLRLYGVVKSLPQDKFCDVCNLPTDGKKCYSKRCPV